MIIRSNQESSHPISNCKSHKLLFQVLDLELKCKKLSEVNFTEDSHSHEKVIISVLSNGFTIEPRMIDIF